MLEKQVQFTTFKIMSLKFFLTFFALNFIFIDSIPISTISPSTISTTNICKKYHSSTTISNATIVGSLEIDYDFTSGVTVHIVGYFSSPKSNGQVEAYNPQTFAQICEVSTSAPTKTCDFQASHNRHFQWHLRTSTMPDGFDLIETHWDHTGQVTTPSLSVDLPCKTETHPYNYGTNTNLTATTTFCCKQYS